MYYWMYALHYHHTPTIIQTLTVQFTPPNKHTKNNVIVILTQFTPIKPTNYTSRSFIITCRLAAPPARTVAILCRLMDLSGLRSCKLHSEYTKLDGGTLGIRLGKTAAALSSVNIRTLPPVVWCVPSDQPRQHYVTELTQPDRQTVSQLTTNP
jgi:hypothetical protein